jgi:hypothetical protein
MKESRHRLMSVLSFSLALLFAGSSVWALAPATSLQELGRSAPSIVQGHVVKLRYARNADESLIYTWVTMKVHRAIKGSLSSDHVRFRVMGGHIGNLGLYVPEAPALARGEEAIVLLAPDEEGLLTVHGQRRGKFSIRDGVVQGLGVTPARLAGVLTGILPESDLGAIPPTSSVAGICPITCDPASSPVFTWPQPAMGKPLLINPIPMDGCTQDQWIAAVFAGADAWNQAMAQFVFTPIVGTTDLTSHGKQPDGNNVIYVGSTGGQLAYTTLWFDFNSGTLLENDVVISVAKKFFQWSCEADAQPGEYDVQGAVTHELGHFLYLPDITTSGCRDLVMYGAEYWDDLALRTLKLPDVCGIATLYP